MQLHQLRYAVAIADLGTFTAAAASLRVAQPSVSTQIRLLERELGSPLFSRTRREVQLTAAGEVFLPWARQALADCDAGAAGVRELLGLRRGRLAVGATPSLTTGLLPPIVAAFTARYPGIELSLAQAGSRDLVARLEQGRLDVGLLILPVASGALHTVPIADEELVLAVSPGSPLAGRGEISIADLRGVGLVMFREGYDLREATLSACRAAGFEPRLVVSGAEMDGVLAFAAGGVGAAVVPASVVPPAGPPGVPAGGPLIGVRFAGGALRRTIGIGLRRDRPLPRAAGAFLSELSGVLAAGGAGSGSGLQVRPLPRGGRWMTGG